MRLWCRGFPRVAFALFVHARAFEYTKIHGDDPSIYDGQRVMSETERVRLFHEVHGQWPVLQRKPYLRGLYAERE